MKVLIIQQYFYPDNSAVAQLLTELTVALSNHYDHEIHVLCSSNSTEFQKSLRWVGPVRVHRVPIPPLGRQTIIRRVIVLAGYYLSCFLWALFSWSYDVVIVFTTPPFVGFVVALAMIFNRRRLIYYIEDLYPEILLDCGIVRRPWLIKKLGALNRITLRRADTVVTISSDITRKLYLNYGYPKRRVVEVPNWSTGVYYVSPKQNGLVIMYSGNFGMGHDFALLPVLIRQLAKQTDVHYQFIGGGVRLSEVQQIFRNSGEPRVTFRRHVKLRDLSATFAVAHYFVLAQSEQVIGDLLPSKFYGYLAAGRPVIFLGARRSEIGRMICDGKLGFVVETERDATKLGAELTTAIENWEEYCRWCSRIAMYYGDHFGLERSASEINRTIAKLSTR